MLYLGGLPVAHVNIWSLIYTNRQHRKRCELRYWTLWSRIRFLFGQTEGKNILPISLHSHRKEPKKLDLWMQRWSKQRIPKELFLTVACKGDICQLACVWFFSLDIFDNVAPSDIKRNTHNFRPNTQNWVF